MCLWLKETRQTKHWRLVLGQQVPDKVLGFIYSHCFIWWSTYPSLLWVQEKQLMAKCPCCDLKLLRLRLHYCDKSIHKANTNCNSREKQWEWNIQIAAPTVVTLTFCEERKFIAYPAITTSRSFNMFFWCPLSKQPPGNVCVFEEKKLCPSFILHEFESVWIRMC